MYREKLQFSLEPKDVDYQTFRYDDIITKGLSELELDILECVANGASSVEDLSHLLGVEAVTISNNITQMRIQGLYFVFYDNPPDNIIDQYLIADILPPPWDNRSLKDVAKENAIDTVLLKNMVLQKRKTNPHILNIYRQILLPELIKAGYTQ